MSMISAQIDELREMALWLDDEFYDAEATKLRDAADTIWQLRDDLQRANAENDRLREQGERLFDKTLELGTENSKLRELCKLCEREAENAKLRELCADMWGTMGLLDACAVDDGSDEPLNCCTGCNQYGRVDELAGGKRVVGCKLMYRMRELGVET